MTHDPAVNAYRYEKPTYKSPSAIVFREPPRRGLHRSATQNNQIESYDTPSK